MFPEAKNISRSKIAAASSAFLKTWKEPVLIEKDDDDDESSTDNFNSAFLEFQADDRYTDPNECSHEELTHFCKNIVKCLPVTLGFFSWQWKQNYLLVSVLQSNEGMA